jgi:hypothetical protein
VPHGTDVIFTHRVHNHNGVWTRSDVSGRECAYRTAAAMLLLAYDHATAR